LTISVDWIKYKIKDMNMKNKIEEVITQVEGSERISVESKPLILEKLQEWKSEEKVVNDVAVRFENWWMEMEPIFAELGWI
jgi:type III secretory pathway component EscV